MRYKIEKEYFEEVVKNSLSKAEVCRKLNIRPVGGNYKTINAKIKLWDIDISHFTGRAWNQGIFYKPIKQKIPLETILVENSTYTSNSSLKKRLIDNKLKEYKCEICAIDKWNDKSISLELNHKNGINTDNRIENLEFLCPNCHSQTHNFRGRNKNKSLKNEQSSFIYNTYKNISEIEKDKLKEKNKYNKPKETKKEKILIKSNCLNCDNIFTVKKGKCFCSLECYKIYKRKRIPNKEDIIEAFNELKSFVKVGEKFNVSDNAIRKWCVSYGMLEDMKKKYKNS